MGVPVTYDIPDDGRRAALHRRLVGFLTPVQKSVFEWLRVAAGYVRLVRIVTHQIEQMEDDARIHRLCPECRKSTLLGAARMVEDRRLPVVV